MTTVNDRRAEYAEFARMLLPLSTDNPEELRAKLEKPRLERAIGVIYRPETELASHYFEANMPKQFDEFIWIDRTAAVAPLQVTELESLSDTYSFGV